MSSDSEDELTLPADTLAALAEFRNEEKERTEKFQKLLGEADEQFRAQKDIELFKEDWQLSQFWYNNKTATLLAEELLDGADNDTYIAIVSAPSVYAAMTKLDKFQSLAQNVYLLEFDKRFVHLAGESHFVFYDFNHPLELPQNLLGKFHRVLADPPFLSEDCQSKTAQSVKSLLSSDKTSKTSSGTLRYRFISCTGERMASVIKKQYPDTNITTFLPEHERGLSNEFRCYASYEGAHWRFQN